MLSAEELKQISDIMEKQIKSVKDEMNTRFDKIDERFDILEERLEEARGTAIEASKYIETYFGHQHPYPIGINEEENA